MNKTAILVVCRHEQILQTIIRLINNNPQWHSEGAISDEDAIGLFLAGRFDLVLIGNGINEASESKLRAACTAHSPGVTFIQHYGGGSGLLSAEIYGALSGKK